MAGNDAIGQGRSVRGQPGGGVHDTETTWRFSVVSPKSPSSSRGGRKSTWTPRYSPGGPENEAPVRPLANSTGFLLGLFWRTAASWGASASAHSRPASGGDVATPLCELLESISPGE